MRIFVTMRNRLLISLLSLGLTVACAGQNRPVKTVIPERLEGLKEAVFYLDSAVNALYGWEPRDSTFSNDMNDRLTGLIERLNEEEQRYSSSDEYPSSFSQKEYDEARATWAEFKKLCEADEYEKALDFYFGTEASSRGKNSGDFIVFLKHSTYQYLFTSEVLQPLLFEYRDRDFALQTLIDLLELQKAMGDMLIYTNAEDGGYVPELYPFVLRDLGYAYAESGREEDAIDLFELFAGSVYLITGNPLKANFSSTLYLVNVYMISGDAEAALGTWDKFKSYHLAHGDEYDPEELEACLEQVELEIAEIKEYMNE